jgi:hypothetical protein
MMAPTNGGRLAGGSPSKLQRQRAVKGSGAGDPPGTHQSRTATPLTIQEPT